METYIASDKTMAVNMRFGFEIKAENRKKAMEIAQIIGQQHGWNTKNIILMRCFPNPALEIAKRRFQILVEMVNELLPQNNAVDFLATINSHLSATLGELTKKSGETEDTRYSRIEDEVEKRLQQR